MHIDWSADSYSVTDETTIDLSASGGIDRESMLRYVARCYEQDVEHDHYVYCLTLPSSHEYDWYVGETTQLEQRISTHIREKGVTNIERLENVPDKETALDREQEMFLEVAIDKESTKLCGGR